MTEWGCCRIISCGVNEVVVKSGWLNKESTKQIGGGTMVIMPCCQIVQRLSLNNMTLSIYSRKIYTREGIPVDIQGTAVVKIFSGRDATNDVQRAKEMLHLERACQHFLGMSEGMISRVATDTMEGHQRGIIGAMDALELITDKKKFAHAVEETAREDLAALGLNLVSYTINNVEDNVGFLNSWGIKKNEGVLARAQIGEAEKQRDSAIKEATTQQATKSAQYENAAITARAEADREIKKAEFMIETNTKQAEADLGHQLQTAKTNQKIKAETMQSKVISKKAEVSVQDQEILRQERILDSAVRKPATAAAYKIRIDAEAEAQKMIYEAQADSSAIVSRGLANADRIEKLGSAEGQAMKKKAEEMSKFTAEAIIEMVATTVPKIAAEISGPMSKANKVTMISGPGGDVGIERLTGEVLNIMHNIPELVKEMSGYDLIESVERQTVSLNHPEE